MINDILEMAVIERIAKNFAKAPHQINSLHQSDSEIIDLGGGYENYLAVTTDALVEEISSGLYDDPYFIGWMLATVNFSDLAAVGAKPLGIVVALSFSQGHNELFMEKVAKGISDACQKLNSFVLGGDTNKSGALYLSGCALGLVPKKSVVTRVGARPGDKLYLSGPAGLGSIFAFLRLTKENDQLPDMFYKPEARIKAGIIVREFASCCMDTSDGVIHTLDTLMRLNSCQFVLYSDWGRILHPVALEMCRKKSLPPWLTLASVHGEFELCFSVAEDKEKKFLQKAASTGWSPVLIGEVASGKGVSIKTEKGLVPLDTASIRNISDAAGSDPQAYIARLLNIGAEVKV